MVELVKKDVGNGQSFKLAASYCTKKQIKFWAESVKILITQPVLSYQNNKSLIC